VRREKESMQNDLDTIETKKGKEKNTERFIRLSDKRKKRKDLILFLQQTHIRVHNSIGQTEINEEKKIISDR